MTRLSQGSFAIWVCTFGLHIRVLSMLEMMFLIHVPGPILFHKDCWSTLAEIRETCCAHWDYYGCGFYFVSC